MKSGDFVLYWGYIPVMVLAVLMAHARIDFNLIGIATMVSVAWAELT